MTCSDLHTSSSGYNVENRPLGPKGGVGGNESNGCCINPGKMMVAWIKTVTVKVVKSG